MTNFRRWSVAAVVVVAIGGGVWATRAHTPRHTPPAAAPRSTPAQLLDANITFYEAVARRDSTGALALGRLSQLYLRRARASGDFEDVLRAERAARRSLRNRGSHNLGARQTLAASLLSEHRFTDAAAVARDLTDLDRTSVAYRASLGEIQMELGHYDEARSEFASLAGAASDLSVAPRLARWAELRGHPDSAYQLLNASLLTMLARRDVPPEQVAWFWLRMGDLQLRRGKISDAEYAYGRGLGAHADDYRLLAAMAKLEAAREHWRAAIGYGDRAVAVSLDPATLGAMSDAYAALGDSAKAEEYAHGMEVAVLSQATAYHRAWSLFLLDHGRRVNEVLANAQAELRTRTDIYGYDVVAWALHARGRDREAREEMSRAMQLGTEDAMLFYHAGMIDRALGNTDAAAAELQRAAAIDPYFRPWGAR